MGDGFLFHGDRLYPLKEDVCFPHPSEGPIRAGSRGRNVDPKLGRIAGRKIIIQALAGKKLTPSESRTISTEIGGIKSPGKSPYIGFIGPIGLVSKSVQWRSFKKIFLTTHQIDHA